LGKHLHNGVPLWSPLNLLGLFLSSMGPAPVGATKQNFFLPMTAMFGRWCQQLVHKSPPMFNCTWESENGPAKFFLGASLTGGSFDLFQPAVGTWKSVVRRARYGLMGREVLSESLAGSSWSFNHHPQSEINQKKDIRIGNCAEMLSLSLSASVSSSSCERGSKS